MKHLDEVYVRGAVDPLEFMVDVYYQYCQDIGNTRGRGLENKEIVDRYIRPYGLNLWFNRDFHLKDETTGREIEVELDDFNDRLMDKYGINY